MIRILLSFDAFSTVFFLFDFLHQNCNQYFESSELNKNRTWVYRSIWWKTSCISPRHKEMFGWRVRIIMSLFSNFIHSYLVRFLLFLSHLSHAISIYPKCKYYNRRRTLRVISLRVHLRSGSRLHSYSIHESFIPGKKFTTEFCVNW